MIIFLAMWWQIAVAVLLARGWDFHVACLWGAMLATASALALLVMLLTANRTPESMAWFWDYRNALPKRFRELVSAATMFVAVSAAAAIYEAYRLFFVG